MGGLKYLCVHTNTQEIQQVRTSDKSTHTDADADPAGVGLYSAGAAEMTLSLWLRRTTVAENGVKGRGLNIHQDTFAVPTLTTSCISFQNILPTFSHKPFLPILNTLWPCPWLREGQNLLHIFRFDQKYEQCDASWNESEVGKQEKKDT